MRRSRTRQGSFFVALAAVATILVSAPAVAAQGEPRIVGGTQASQGEYPAQGYLLINADSDPDPEFSCGGTVVGGRQFLTAAHCAVDGSDNPLPADRFDVYLGDADLSPPIPASSSRPSPTTSTPTTRATRAVMEATSRCSL